MQEGILKGVELFGDIHQLTGDAGRPHGVNFRADVHDDQFFQHIGVASGEGHAAAPAHGVPDQRELLDSHRVAELFKISHESVGRVVAARRPVGLATAPLV